MNAEFLTPLITISRRKFVAGFSVMGVSPSVAQPIPEEPSGGPIRFYADLSADEEVATTESPGEGRVLFSLDRATLRFTWKLTYARLTSPAIAAHIHGPQTRGGGNAGVLINLAPNGMKSPVQGDAVLNDGQLEYLLTSRLYVNVHTVKFPQGEVRGHIQRGSPPLEGRK